MPALDLTATSVDLTRTICDIPSVSGDEAVLADAIDAAIRPLPHLEVYRDGDTIVARTQLGRPQRVVIAGHIDTVPINDNVPTRDVAIDGEPYLWGRGTVDMKAGVAVQLKLAAELTEPRVDITWMWYDHEEVDADLNGLTRLARTRPDLFAGRLRHPRRALQRRGRGRLQRQHAGDRAHARRPRSQRPRLGRRERDPQGGSRPHPPCRVPAPAMSPSTASSTARGSTPFVSGAGWPGTSSPTLNEIEVNYRFAPSRSAEAAERHVRDVFAGFDVDVVDIAVGARPGLDAPLAQEFVAAVGGEARPKYGWTDVARFSRHGRARRQLRSGRPAPRASRRGAGAARTDRGRGTRTARVADHALTRPAPARVEGPPGGAADRHPVPRRTRGHDRLPASRGGAWQRPTRASARARRSAASRWAGTRTGTG